LSKLLFSDRIAKHSTKLFDSGAQVVKDPQILGTSTVTLALLSYEEEEPGKGMRICEEKKIFQYEKTLVHKMLFHVHIYQGGIQKIHFG
jgi:hypothetical protein